MREEKGKVVLEGKVVIKKLALLQGSCQLLHVQAAIRLMRVSLQIRAFLGLFGADFYADI